MAEQPESDERIKEGRTGERAVAPRGEADRARAERDRARAEGDRPPAQGAPDEPEVDVGQRERRPRAEGAPDKPEVDAGQRERRPRAEGAPDEPDAGAGQRERRPPEQKRRKNDEGAEGQRPAKKPWFKRPLPMGIVIAVVTAALIFGVLWWRHSRKYEKTDDAYVDIVSERVSSQVAGRVLRVLVNDNQDVTAGQVLLEIDPADFRVRLEQARAGQAQAEAQVAQAEAQRAIREAEVEQAKASAAAAATSAKNATSDLQRLQTARAQDEGVASAQQVEHAQAEQRSTDAQRQAAEKAVAAAQAQLALVSRQIDAAKAAVRSAAAQVAQAELTLSYTQVRATVDGRVASRTVGAGNYISPGTDLMAIVPRAVYVTAEFKETQLDHLRVGQPVEVRVDAYKNLRLHGRVDSVQAASGSAFTPLPAQNAAGNWVKVVQRVPVKITLNDIPNDPSIRLGPGMSAEVTVSLQ